MSNTKNRVPAVADPSAQAVLSKIKSTVGYYLVLCLVTLGVIYLLRDHPDLVNDAAWTRGIIVTGSAVLTYSFASSAARGNARGLLRLRIVSAVMLVAITAIISVHGTFPTWMKIEQAVCGLLMLRIAILANGRQVRSYFATR